MRTRRLGRTGLDVSILGFGCGAIGGLMVRGAPADQERAVARAITLGVNYFDTAPQYGEGASELNLGRVLKSLRADVRVGTKVRLQPADRGGLTAAITTSLDASLVRLGRDHVDLVQLHNRIGEPGAGDMLSERTVLGEVADAFDRLRRAGKTRFIGITALGQTDALQRVIDSGRFDTAQVVYNALNPSAAGTPMTGAVGQDYANLIGRVEAAGMGLIAVRVLAGGALAGLDARHPVAKQDVEPIGSAASYAEDLARARLLAPIVAAGHASSLAEAALRYVLAEPRVATALIGVSSLGQLESAIQAATLGPLPLEVMQQVRTLLGQRSRA